jgi:hypothetical protein
VTFSGVILNEAKNLGGIERGEILFQACPGIFMIQAAWLAGKLKKSSYDLIYT